MVKKPPLDQANIPNPGVPMRKPDLFINKVWFAKWVENPDVSPLVPITPPSSKGSKFGWSDPGRTWRPEKPC
jgi:hypothetical protein